MYLSPEISELSEDFQKNKMIKTENEKESLLETIIDLRQYRPLGRIFIVDLLELPPQAKEIKGWVMQQGWMFLLLRNISLLNLCIKMQL